MVNGSTSSRETLIEQFLARFVQINTFCSFPLSNELKMLRFQFHDLFLSLYRYPTHNISKRQVDFKISEIATKEQRRGWSRPAWFVKPEFLRLFVRTRSFCDRFQCPEITHYSHTFPVLGLCLCFHFAGSQRSTATR
jgi:hypothetical protein